MPSYGSCPIDITYEIENSSTGKTNVVHVDHLKKLIGDGISENQYISDSDESIDIEHESESERNSDEEGDNDNALRASLHSQPSSPLQSVSERKAYQACFQIFSINSKLKKNLRGGRSVISLLFKLNIYLLAYTCTCN